MVTLAFHMYEIVDEFLEDIINMKWASEVGKLAILGGIIISDG
jgi:hypothetical protein